MYLGDTLAGALPGLRAQAESMMRETCTITRKQVTAYDPGTGRTADTYTQVYAGPCRVKGIGGSATDEGALTRASATIVASLPVAAAPAIQVGDYVTITTAALDPILAGRTFTIQTMTLATYATAARYSCQEVTR